MNDRRIKIRPAFMLEIERFERSSTSAVPPRTDAGLQQFARIESLGEWPDVMEPYCESLVGGKKWWEWTVNQQAERYLTEEWFGWPVLLEDFAADEGGFKQIVKRIAQKHRSLDVQRMMRIFREWHDPAMRSKRERICP